MLTRRGIDHKKCKQSLYLLRTGHRAAQASSIQRLRGALPGSRHYGRLRAHMQSLSQMPIAAPVNFSGGQVSRNKTNSGIGRTDGLRTLLRHTACKVRWNVAFSYTKGTVHQCLLGNITENEPRKVTGPRRRLGMCGFSSDMGHPHKNNRKKLRTRTATESRDMQHGRRLSWHQELVGTYWRHQLVPLVDSPANALSFPLAHRSGTNLNQELTDVGTSACLKPRTQIRRDGRYGFAAPVSSARRFTSERIVASLGSSEWHESEPATNGRRLFCVTGIVRRVKDAEEGHER